MFAVIIKKILNTVVPAMLIALFAACDDGPDLRAEADEEVGRFSSNRIDMRVSKGAAQIHRANAQGISVWAQAPAFTFTVTPRSVSPDPFTVLIKNVHQTAVLNTAHGTGGISITSRPGSPHSTWKSWDVSGLEVGTPTVFTLRPPTVTDVSPWTFAVVNDPHSASAMASVIPLINDTPEVEMVISGGDLGVNTTERCTAFQDALQSLGVPFYATVGNVDIRGGGDSWHAMFGRYSYHFTYRGVGFNFVDSASATIAPVIFDALNDWLNTPEDLTMFITHIPPIDPYGTRNAGFRNHSEAVSLLNTLSTAGVDLIIAGHLHQYNDYELADIPVITSGPNGHIDTTIERYLLVDVFPEEQRFHTTRVW